jgi:sugar phosphate permease
MIPKNSLSYRWVILLIFVSSQLVLSIVGYGWGPLAPFLKKAMTLSGTQIGTISSVFYFTAALIAFPGGVIVDRYGVKLGLLAWLGFTGFPMLFLGFIYHEYSILLVLVAIAGLGYGLGNPVSSKGLFMWFNKKTRGTVFGIKQAAVTLGAALAGVLLVYLSQKFGPFSALGIIGIVITVMIILSSILYHDPQGTEDIPYETVPEEKKSIISRLSYFFTDRTFVILSIIMAVLGLAQGIVATFLILFINEKLGFSLIAAGSILAVVMISGAVGRIIWGIVSDRLFNGRRKPVLMIISLLATLTVTILAFWGIDWPKQLFIPVVIGIGLALAGWNSIALVFVAEISPSNKTATYIGLASTITWFGLSIGPIAFGSITDHLGYFTAWISLAIFCLLSFFLCFFVTTSD